LKQRSAIILNFTKKKDLNYQTKGKKESPATVRSRLASSTHDLKVVSSKLVSSKILDGNERKEERKKERNFSASSDSNKRRPLR